MFDFFHLTAVETEALRLSLWVSGWAVAASLPLGVLAAWVLAAVGVWISFFIAGITEWYFGDAESMLIYLAIIGCALGPRSGSW